MFGGFIMVFTPCEVWLLGGILANLAGLFTGIALVRRLGLGQRRRQRRREDLALPRLQRGSVRTGMTDAALSPEDAAAYLGCKPSTARELMR